MMMTNGIVLKAFTNSYCLFSHSTYKEWIA